MRGGKVPEAEPNLVKLDADPAEWKAIRENFPYVPSYAWEENMEDGGKPPGLKWQLAFFSMNGTVRYVISGDSDLLVFGAKQGFRSLVKPVITEGIQFCFQSVFIGCILSPFGRRVQLEQKENAETVSERRVQLEQENAETVSERRVQLEQKENAETVSERRVQLEQKENAETVSERRVQLEQKEKRATETWTRSRRRSKRDGFQTSNPNDATLNTLEGQIADMAAPLFAEIELVTRPGAPMTDCLDWLI
ncbi:hypothetical protein Bbelb_050190 [Branchiostoma belcheri]|nr:hypothetical protein Bbelb_050190 [Branchiostoma belcheri]